MSNQVQATNNVFKGAEGVNPLEAKLLEIWEDVLEVQEIGVNDDFFDLGGHSLLSVEIRARIKKALGVSFVKVDLLVTPTVASMAASILEQVAAVSSGASLQQDALAS